ncbi:hypothetical protein Lsha_0399 [Legionella shakespearei DSM 23087]|uniref:Uncharacterized protein n=1 Tax=Legionella shakespearei DSM 23087 TaxID=1122169 RepID=A0A0W0Z889_9GAMM|nr:hypothetical protein Lsha_0399 [Legionella shakespearei DSM 23087]
MALIVTLIHIKCQVLPFYSIILYAMIRCRPQDPRRPERVFLREGSPEIGTVPVHGDPSRKKTRSGRRRFGRGLPSWGLSAGSKLGVISLDTADKPRDGGIST